MNRRQILSLGGNPDRGGEPLNRSEYLWRLGSNFGVRHLMEMAGMRESEPFDAGTLLVKYPACSRGEKHILVFLTELADGRPGPEGYRFDAVKACADWDDATRRTFATWALNPHYPSR